MHDIKGSQCRRKVVKRINAPWKIISFLEESKVISGVDFVKTEHIVKQNELNWKIVCFL